MATITPKEKDGKIIAFKFRTCVGRDENGKQVSRATTWQVPENLSMVRLEKAAQRAAADWEKQARAEYEKDLYDPERIKAREVDRTKTDFVRFVLEEWYPICIDNGERKPKTVSFYHDTIKNIVAHFQGQIVQKISAPAIQKFLIYLRTEKGFAPQNVHHHYRTLNMIFAYHVRFISVNDQYDSECADNSGSQIALPLKNLMNEAYAADISRKVRTQQNQAMRAGEFVGSRPPYGYRKDPDNCHRLLVNEDTAPVVRQIFQWAADGTALNAIVKRLNETGVPTPSHYLASIGLISHEKLIGSGKWQSRTVGKILADQVYTGDMVQGKTRSVRRKQSPTPQEDWIVVQDTHEPLISRELFEQAQAARSKTAAKYVQNEKASGLP